MADEEIPMGQVTPEEKEEVEQKSPSTPVKKKPAAKAKSPKAKSPKESQSKSKRKGQTRVKGKGQLFEKACCKWRDRTAKEETSSSWLGRRVAGG